MNRETYRKHHRAARVTVNITGTTELAFMRYRPGDPVTIWRVYAPRNMRRALHSHLNDAARMRPVECPVRRAQLWRVRMEYVWDINPTLPPLTA